MTRDEISALLPFLANGTLEGDERAEVEAALAEDAALQGELRALQAIRATMQAEEAYSPGDMGLARLMRGVEAEAPVAAPSHAPSHAPSPAPSPGQSRTWLWQAAAAVLLAVVVGQSAWQFRTGPAPGGYRLAGGDEAAFVIAVAPGASEADLRALLLRAGVVIVDGPSALGFYGLAMIEGVSLDEARAVLQASPLIDDLQGPQE